MNSEQLEVIADRLFGAFTDHDLDTVATMLATDAVITQNGQSFDWDSFRAVLEGTLKWIGNHRYEQITRLYSHDAIVEEHIVRSTTANGTQIKLAACVVVRIKENGQIRSIDEYVDTSSLL